MKTWLPSTMGPMTEVDSERTALEDLQDLLGNRALLSALDGLLGDSPEADAERTAYADPLSQGFSWSDVAPERSEPGVPYLYGGQNDDGGFDFGGGMQADRDDDGESVYLSKWDAHAGVWRNGNARRYGFSGNAGAVGGTASDGGVSGSVDGPSGSVQAWGGEDGFEVGVQGNAAQGAVSYGSGARADRDDDWSVKGGVSAGEGAAVRGYWTDEDGDGVEEVGFGFDAGPVAFDVKTEYGVKQKKDEVDRDLRENYLPLLESAQEVSDAGWAVASDGAGAASAAWEDLSAWWTD